MDKKETISLEEAQRLILGVVEALDSEVVPLAECRGRVLAEEVRARRDYPPLPRSAMDGYAVRSKDHAQPSPQGVSLKVTGLTGPGAASAAGISRGEAVRILTGGPLPPGADAVVPQEMVETVPGGIRLHLALKPGDYVIPAGSEAREGQSLMNPGLVLEALELTVLADLGHPEVRVRRRPRVAILATGDELAAAGEPESPHSVFPSNLQLLLHLVRAAGGEPASLEAVEDRTDLLVAALRRGLGVEVVVTTGGTGKGERDLVAAAVTEVGGEFLFRGVAMRPGKRALCAKVGQTLVFGLPGRTPAAQITFLQLVRPALLAMLGLPRVYSPEVAAKLAQPLQVQADLTSFIHSRLSLGGDVPEVCPVAVMAVGLMAQMLAANSLVVIPPGREQVGAGERVRVQPLNLGLEVFRYFTAPDHVQ
ncbi:MAG TPA: gephyrin-like molybdotransferase Glp [Syntrophobacteria bacterium]|nr:gephyrin-like molybdotransferase Glp [Syntrophobacteria bacterium]